MVRGGHRGARPGPKPRRLYARLVRFSDPSDGPEPAVAAAAWLAELDRVGRLVAAGATTDPRGHLLVFRAASRAEAERVLRADPFRGERSEDSSTWEWAMDRPGTGINLEPPPARGSGRLTVLNRISVFVRDQRGAVAWYRDVLGLTVRSEDADTEFVELSLGPGAAGLTLVRPRPEWGEPYYSEAEQRIGQRTGIAFQTDSVEALSLRLEHAGARVTVAPRTEPWGGRSVRFSDPDGNEFLAFDGGPATPSNLVRPARRRHRRRLDPDAAVHL